MSERAQIDGAVMLAEAAIRSSALNTNVDLHIKTDDSVMVTYGGTTMTYPTTQYPSNAEWSLSFGSPKIVTLERFCFGYKRGWQCRWRVRFVFGGVVEAWPTSTYEAGRASARRSENKMIWMWMYLPESLTDVATGMCARQCAWDPPLPYTWCDGEASCLPTKVDDSLFTPAQITSLESKCGLATGSSQRPDTCSTRPAREVDCGFVSGEAIINPAIQWKWPKNLGIASGRHSGGATPSFTDLAQYPSPGDKGGYAAIAATDGMCDAGRTCNDGCTCSNNVMGGCGGAVDDTDCSYSYEIRAVDPTGDADLERYSTPQACWDFCTSYIDGIDASACRARKLLANGGELHCGYKTGKWTSYTNGLDSPYYGRRCNVFVSPGELQTVGPWAAANGDTHSAGPYANFHMTDHACASAAVQLCAPTGKELCDDSGTSMSDAQAACVLFNGTSPAFEDCIYCVCATGNDGCGDDEGPHDWGEALIGPGFPSWPPAPPLVPSASTGSPRQPSPRPSSTAEEGDHAMRTDEVPDTGTDTGTVVAIAGGTCGFAALVVAVVSLAVRLRALGMCNKKVPTAVVVAAGAGKPPAAVVATSTSSEPVVGIAVETTGI